MNLTSTHPTFNTSGQPIDTHFAIVAAEIERLATATDTTSYGATFTRTEVADFVLDLLGYTTDQSLHKMRLLEPSFGAGSFLLPAIGRLLTVWKASTPTQTVVEALGGAIRGIELHRQTFSSTRFAVIELLKQSAIAEPFAIALADRWLIQGDFLLTSCEGKFDFIAGNPPYVRQELISAPLLAEYRNRYPTMYDRADLYVPFIERSLSMLSGDGSLGFICSDRWMKNRYGGPLRRLVADQFHMKIIIDMVDTPAFHSDVIAYPAITIISRKTATTTATTTAATAATTRIALRPAIDKSTLAILTAALLAPQLTQRAKESGLVRELTNVTNGSEPWLFESSNQLALIRRIENQFPSLENANCKVGIGVATGADKVYIGDFNALDVESDRKLPLVTTKDIVSGEVRWCGQGVINPFAEGGGLVELSNYPRLCRYLEARRELIASRHCARKAPVNWYRTIDRITPELAFRPKLLIPDIKGEAHIVFEEGKLYPHHNLYYVTSDEWNLRALQAVMLSDVTRLFMTSYSTKMRGGFFRFQAQYLRRIRIPKWADVPTALRVELAEAAIHRDFQACNRAAFKLFKISNEERSALEGNGE